MTDPRPLDPRWRVLYLGSVAAAVFLVPWLWLAGILLAVHCALWLIVGLPPRKLLRQLYKLLPFSLFLLLSYALTDENPATDRWIDVSLLGLGLRLNTSGALVGALMVLRMGTVILAAHVCRAGDSRALAAG